MRNNKSKMLVPRWCFIVLRWLPLLFLAAMALIIWHQQAAAFYKAEYANDPARSLWFQSLKDCYGRGCCGLADGEPYFSDYTENADGSITLANGERLSDCQVLRISNPIGHAIWFHRGTHTYCFVPGGGT